MQRCEVEEVDLGCGSSQIWKDEIDTGSHEWTREAMMFTDGSSFEAGSRE